MSLYKEVLMEHFRNPKFKFQSDKGNRVDGVNPSCGDNITLFYTTNSGLIENLSFTGNGCAISMASGDIMCEILNSNANLEVIDKFINMVEGDQTIIFDNDLNKLEVFKELQKFPARRNCALLPWKTLKKSLNQ